MPEPLTQAQQQVVILTQVWDDLDQAISRLLTAQPHQMTEAADRVTKCKDTMRKAMQQWGYDTWST